MKTVALSDVEAKLSALAADSGGEPVLITRDGRPVGILYAADPDDMERLVLAHSPRFQALLEKGRQQIRDGKGIPHDEFWAEFGLGPLAKPKPKRRKKAV
jgi:antitoxin (DNA-binding transcriptional repressor) of toxin-antitoxin stability system